jgi:hypothetical protein
VEDIRMRLRRAVAVIFLIFALPVLARAQSPGVPALTFTGGWAGFADEGLIHHSAVGVGAEWVPTPHLSVGPELLYMVGPSSDRDLMVLGVARVGILPLRSRIAPFVTVGGGIMTHTNKFGGQSYSSTEGGFLFGGGVRINASPRVFVAPEFTMGWEPHMRVSVAVGIRF